jgi:hypothetical protein
MRTTQSTPPLSPPPFPPPSWDSLTPSRRRRLLVLVGAMVLEALRAPPHAAQVNDERRQR